MGNTGYRFGTAHLAENLATSAVEVLEPATG